MLLTKLHRPAVTPDVVQRDRLLESLQENQSRPFTLISAPPGYGKTMLASAWVELSKRPCAWVSLDSADDELQTFLSYWLASLQRAFPERNWRFGQLLESPGSASVSYLAQALISEVDQIEEPFFIVFDDLHTINSDEIYQLLNEYLRHPPHSAHLVLISRVDPGLPLPYLRAQGQVTEIRVRDLRFTAQETARLLAIMLDTEVDEAVVADLLELSEGWVTALRLAALSFRHKGAAESIQPALAAHNAYVHDYLLGELLGTLTVLERECLLNLSILDRFCAELCDHLCQDKKAGRDAPAFSGRAFMQWLQQSNLFLVDLDQQNKWFRFHHLFQADLRRMLEAEASRQEVATLHLKASQWFADNGWVREAIRHALAAGNPDLALEVFTDHRLEAMNAGRWNELERRVRLFPEEVVDNSPVLLLTRAHLPLSYGFDHDLGSLLARAASLLGQLPTDAPQTQRLMAELSYFAGLGALMEGPAVKAISAGATMNSMLPESAYFLRVQALALEAFGHQMSGNIEQGTQLFQEALGADKLPANLQIKACFNQSLLYFVEADLATAQIFAENGIKLASMHSLDASEARCFAGMIHYLRNDLQQAEARLLPVMSHRAWIDPLILAHSACTLMHVYYAQGKAEEARKVAQQARSQLEEQGNAFSLQLFDMFQGELALEQGDGAQARQLILPLNVSSKLPIWFWHYYVPQLTPIKLWLAEGEQAERALSLLDEMDDFLRNTNRNIHRIDILALQALAYKALNNWPKALEKLAQSVELAARGELIRNYLNLGPQMRELLTQLHIQGYLEADNLSPYIAQILDAFPTENAETVQPASPPFISVDPLTEREREVLNLLATNLTTKEIAGKLNISWATTRTHIKNMYSKLGAHSRYEAVLRAKEHKLL